MSLIAVFSQSGVSQTNTKAASNYLYGQYCSLSDEQKAEYSGGTQLIKLAHESGDIQLAYEANHTRSQVRGIKRNPPPEPINGNRVAVDYAIANNPHKHKYVSGVISHASNDTAKLIVNPNIEAEWRELFEDLCFAGLPKDERLIDWVRHTHQPIIENHYLIPRIHLRTGKSFNPAYPGHERDFNLLRDYLNLKHDLADPNDPLRKRLAHPSRRNDKTSQIVKQLNAIVKTFIQREQIRHRGDVVALLNRDEVKKAFGINNVEISFNFVRIQLDGREKAIRLKGFVFTEQFTSLATIKQGEPTLITKQERLDELEAKLTTAIEKRAAFNLKRYGESPSQKNDDNTMGKEANKEFTQRMNDSFPIPSNSNDFLPLPGIDDNLTGWEKIVAIESRKTAAHINAIAAMLQQAKTQSEQLIKILEEIRRKRRYEPFRESVEQLFAHNEQAARNIIDDAKSRATRTISAIQSDYRATHDGVSERTSNPFEQNRDNPRQDDSRIQSLSERVGETIETIRESISVSESCNEADRYTSERIGELTTATERNIGQLQRGFADIVNQPALLDRLKARVKRNELEKSKPLPQGKSSNKPKHRTKDNNNTN
ncbi:relaxase/mobilization nuclease domain-containing protein, partial [Vibrio cyclitrophicus]